MRKILCIGLLVLALLSAACGSVTNTTSTQQPTPTAAGLYSAATMKSPILTSTSDSTDHAQVFVSYQTIGDSTPANATIVTWNCFNGANNTNLLPGIASLYYDGTTLRLNIIVNDSGPFDGDFVGVINSDGSWKMTRTDTLETIVFKAATESPQYIYQNYNGSSCNG